MLQDEITSYFLETTSSESAVQFWEVMFSTSAPNIYILIFYALVEESSVVANYL
jgi:hypothetical protein